MFDPYTRTISQPTCRTIVVWVLNSPHGTEYVAGDRAVPPIGRAADIVARIGPIAYEDGQGLEPFKEQIDALAKDDAERARERIQSEGLKDMIRREIASRMPSATDDAP